MAKHSHALKGRISSGRNSPALALEIPQEIGQFDCPTSLSGTAKTKGRVQGGDRRAKDETLDKNDRNSHSRHGGYLDIAKPLWPSAHYVSPERLINRT
jgi:hypothetical protein